MNEEDQALAVIGALEAYAERLRQIIDAISDRKSIDEDEKNRLQELYAALKADVKEAAKRGKIHNDRAEQTSFERAYFEPAMRDCSNALRAKTNSHPIRSNWMSSLWEAQSEISYFLHQLSDRAATAD